MNWRERYARYRRYGLDPLPQDASHAEREARIAQLRVLRGKRQRKIALRSGLGTLAIAIGGAKRTAPLADATEKFKKFAAACAKR